MRCLAAGFKDTTVESRVVGSDEIRAKKHLPDSRPYLFERGLLMNILPGDAMDMRKAEGAPWGTDQIIFSIHDSIAGHPNKADSASAV